jgi:hypothetical protein
MGDNNWTIEKILEKIKFCCDLLESDRCNDSLFVIFVIAELFKHLGAEKIIGEKLYVNNTTLDFYSFGRRLVRYRNAFAHMSSIEELDAHIACLLHERDSILNELSKANISTKVISKVDRVLCEYQDYKFPAWFKRNNE